MAAIGFLLITFLAVYVPAFALVGGLRLSPDVGVPVVMLVTFTIACGIMELYARRGGITWAAFGFRLPSWRYIVYALIFAVPLSVLIAWLLGYVSEPGPLAGLTLAPWLIYVYFGLAAPIQEEVIFRGLLQTALAERLAGEPRYAATSGMIALLAVAILFAVIHLVVGPATAAGALVLGLLAGELRRRSGSLLPAVICHSIFNLAGILWALHW
ncbi:MAG: lysostaphin resistance A-like protein [Gammaproteobacteria bacterium]